MCGGHPCAGQYVNHRNRQRRACASVTSDELFAGGALSAGDMSCSTYAWEGDTVNIYLRVFELDWWVVCHLGEGLL